MNEESELTTFQSRRGRNNVDMTIVNKHLLKALKNWEISEEKSCSDYNNKIHPRTRYLSWHWIQLQRS